MTRIVSQWQDQCGRFLPRCPPCAGGVKRGWHLQRKALLSCRSFDLQTKPVRRLSPKAHALQGGSTRANMERLYRVEYYSPRVRDAIEAWPVDLLARCDELLDLLEDHGPQLGAPHSKAMGGGLFEIRPRARSGIARAFYCFCTGRVITVLHSFVKKTQKTPTRELLIARERLRNVKRHG